MRGVLAVQAAWGASAVKTAWKVWLARVVGDVGGMGSVGVASVQWAAWGVMIGVGDGGVGGVSGARVSLCDVGGAVGGAWIVGAVECVNESLLRMNQHADGVVFCGEVAKSRMHDLYLGAQRSVPSCVVGIDNEGME